MKRNPSTVPKSVDQYLEVLPEKVCTTLEKLRQAIRKAAPKAEELISYEIPMYKYMGHVVGFAAFEKHCSFFVVNKNILKDYEKELKPFKTAGTTIHFSPENPLPSALVQKIVKRRMKENEERVPAKKTAPNKKSDSKKEKVK